MQDARLVLPALAAWTGAWLGTTGSLLALTIGLVVTATAGIAAVYHHKVWLVAGACVLAVTLVVTWLVATHRHSSEFSELAHRKAMVVAEVKICGEAKRYGRVVVARSEVIVARTAQHEVYLRVPLTLMASGAVGEELEHSVAGARYLVRLKLAPSSLNEPEVAVGRVQTVMSRTAEPEAIDQAVNTLRAGLRNAMKNSPPRQAALVPSLVVGDTSAVEDEMAEEFRKTGLTHLMAVSGANLTLMLGVIVAVARTVGLRGWSIRIATVAGVAGFVVLCGQEPSVTRAAAMGLVALAATGIGRGARSLRGLSVAVLFLIWLDPWMARSIGFALSVAACAGIVTLSPIFLSAMSSWAPRWLAEALAVPLAAQLATQPIITALSGQISMVGIVANVLAGPFVGPTTVIGLVTALLWWCPPAALVTGWIAGWLCQPILWLASAGASLPGSSWQWPNTVLGISILALGCLLAARKLPRILGKLAGTAWLLLVLLLISAVRPLPLGWPGSWNIVFCDVGQGDATIIRAGPASAVLIDAAPTSSAVLSCVDALGIKNIPLLVLTHFHADHVGGAAAVIERFRPPLILVREGTPPTWLRLAAQKYNAVLRSAQVGESLLIGTAQWTTVSVGSASGDGTEGEGSQENNASVIGIADSSGLKVMLAGDAEPEGQSLALRQARDKMLSLNVHILKLPHHGSSRQDPRFFAATGATVAVASAGKNNEYGHPSQSALGLARKNQMEIARTDLEGHIAVTLTSEGLRIAKTANQT